MEFKHKSVLLEETIDGLNIKPEGIYVDGTLGGAGHAQEVCRRLSAKGRFTIRALTRSSRSPAITRE